MQFLSHPALCDLLTEDDQKVCHLNSEFHFITFYELNTNWLFGAAILFYYLQFLMFKISISMSF